MQAKAVNNRGRHAGSGSQSEFEAFFRHHYPDVVRLAHSVVRDLQQAQDVAQEVFVAAYRRFPDDLEGAPGWVRVAAVHAAFNALRGERRRHHRHHLLATAGASPSPEEAVVARETRAEVRDALARLPEKPATVLILRHAGMSYSEIAEAMGTKVSHIGTMLRRAESSLLKEMNRATRN